MLYATRFTSLLLLLLPLSAFAQLAYEPMIWGEIAPADLAMTVYAPDTTAQAVILNDQGYMIVGTDNNNRYEYTLRRHKRIKIFKESALEAHGDVTLYFRHAERNERISGVDARAVTPDGKVITLDKDDIFKEKVDEDWTRVSFGFPAVPAGSVLEYRYQLFSNSVLSPRPWYFRSEIPVRSSYFNFACLTRITYTYMLQGAQFMTANKDYTGAEFLQLGDTRMDVNGTEFWLREGAAVVEEPFMTSADDYYVTARFQASAVFDLYGNENSVFGTWEETSEELLDDEDLGHNFTKKKNFKNLLAAASETIDPSAPEEERVLAINRFVNQEIPWNGEYGIWTDQSPDDAFTKHQGSVADVQYAAIALLRAYGIAADPIVLSTRDNGAMITTFPFLRQFNYVVVLVKVDDRLRLMDFTDPYLKPGFVRTEALNGKGFLLSETTPGWMDVGVPTVRDQYVWGGKITPEGGLEGQMRATMHTISGRDERVRLEEQNLSEIWLDRLPNGAVLSDLAAKDEDDVREPLVVDGTFALPEAGFANDDFLYVSPILFSTFAENPLKSEKRDFPVDFPYPFEEKSIYQLELPEGYRVEALPEEASYILPNLDAQFQYLAQEKGDRLSILIVFKINKTIYAPEEYAALREMFAVAAAKMEEQIVLRKKTDAASNR